MRISSTRRRGFSLVELLTVIAIIALLVAVAVPSLTAARESAKRVVTQGTIHSLEQGCQAFQKETGSYPTSRGLNPFEPGTIPLSGAQWLALQLSGPDLRGFVQPVTANDTNADGKIDYKDWQAWYPAANDPNATNVKKQWARVGPYGPIDPKSVKHLGDPASPDGGSFLAANPGLTPPVVMTTATQAIWPGFMLPFYVDAWGNPILYYEANARAPQAYTTGKPADGANFLIGNYDQSDNAGWTGIDGLNGRFAEYYALNQPFIFSNRDESPHSMGVLGYSPATATKLPPQESFAGVMTNTTLFNQTLRGSDGQVRPHKPDSFVLISAGPNGVFGPVNGRSDDVKNFEN